MAKLNDTQLVILNAAARRKSGAVLPLPKSLKGDQAANDKVLKALLRQKLIGEQLAAAGQPIWREDDDRRLALVITDAGRAAIGEDVGSAEASTSNLARDEKAKPDATRTRAGSKAAGLVALLRRPEGATLSDIMEATGWQAHSVRGAISGMVKKKMGLSVISVAEAGRGRVYRIAEA
jgi:hypothetical protein